MTYTTLMKNQVVTQGSDLHVRDAIGLNAFPFLASPPSTRMRLFRVARLDQFLICHCRKNFANPLIALCAFAQNPNAENVWHVVVSGCVDVCVKTSPEGRTYKMCTFKEGDTFGASYMKMFE